MSEPQTITEVLETETIPGAPGVGQPDMVAAAQEAAARAEAALPATREPEPTVEEPQVFVTETELVTARVVLLEAKAKEMAAYYRLAKNFSQTKMVRKEYRWNGIMDPERPGYDVGPIQNLCAAMMFGAKLGIEPEDAGLLVITINDSPSLESKTMLGIVRSWIDKRVAQGRTKTRDEGGDWVWEVEADEDHVVWAARRDGDEVSVEWTMERAIRADLTTEDHKMNTRNSGLITTMYGKFPIEMLRARCQSEILRIQFSDVLRGMQYSAEELRLVERTKQREAKAERPQGGKGAAALEAGLQRHHHSGFSGSGGGGEAQDTTTAPTAAETADLPATEDVAQGEPMANEKTLTHLHTILTNSGVAERSRKLTVISHIAHRALTSSKELTQEQAENVAATLQNWARDGEIEDRLVQLGVLDPPAAPANDPAAQAPPERASMKQLTDLRKLYRAKGYQTNQMMEHMEKVLGFKVNNVNDLTDVDVADCTRKLNAQ